MPYEEGQQAFDAGGVPRQVYHNGAWHELYPPIGEDIKKVAPGAAATGALGLMTTGPSIYDLGEKGAAALMSTPPADVPVAGKVLGPIASAVQSILPQKVQDVLSKVPEVMGEGYRQAQEFLRTYPGRTSQHRLGDVKRGIEEATGPFYQAQTPLGKGVQTGLEIAPSVMGLSGATIPGRLLQTAGITAGSELAGQKAEGKTFADVGLDLPGLGDQPLGPTARFMGGLGGVAAANAPSAMARALASTSPARSALGEQAHTLVPMSAGQRSGNPLMQQIEATFPMPKQFRPDVQAEAATRSLLKEGMGLTGDRAENAITNKDVLLREGRKIGDAKTQIEQNPRGLAESDIPLKKDGTPKSTIANDPRNMVEFFDENPTFDAIAKKYRLDRNIRKPETQTDIDKLIADIRSETPTSVRAGMPSTEYAAKRDEISTAMREAPDAATREAYAGIRDALDRSWAKTFGPDLTAKLQKGREQYANFKALETAHKGKAGNIDPGDVFDAHNIPESEFARKAQALSSVLRRRNTEPLSPHAAGGLGALIGGIGGGLIGYGLGGLDKALTLGPEGVVSMGLFGRSMLHTAAKPTVSKLLYNKTMQDILANPNRRMISGAPQGVLDPALMARVLALAPPR